MKPQIAPLTPVAAPWRRSVALLVFLPICGLLSACAPISAYNSHVAARSDSLSGYAKDEAFGGSYTHRVEYR